MIDPASFIHITAHVDDDCHVGPGTVIRQFASVTRGTILGAGCSVAPHAVLDGPEFGDRCVICPGVNIGPGFRIGSDVFLGPYAVLANDAYPHADKTGFDYQALRRGDRFAVIVEDGASIGAHALVLPGVHIGEGAMVAGHATVSRDVPAGMLWTRGGEIRPKPLDWRERRMRWAGATEWLYTLGGHAVEVSR